MKRNLVFAVLVLLVPSFAIAHVSVRPRESKPGAEERYTVRVPTEGAVATTRAVLEIPADVTVLEVLPAEGTTFETAKQGDRITSITWKKAIPPSRSSSRRVRCGAMAFQPSTTPAAALSRLKVMARSMAVFGKQSAASWRAAKTPSGCVRTATGRC